MRKTLKVVAFGGGPADAFIKAAGITDSTQQTAIKTLVNDLNGYGLWSKMKAIYPMVGGNATAHSYNLKDTTKFQITWSGGLKHSSTGTIGNGTNGYGNTNLVPLNDLLDNSCHLSFYSRTNESAGNIWDCGVADDARSYLTMLIKNSSTQFRPLAQDFSQSVISNSDSKGFYITNRTASNISNGWKNGTKIISPNANSLTRANLKIFLLSLNYSGTGGAVFYSTKECAFATIGDGLSDTEAANLYTSIQKFQTTLSRQV